MTDLNLALDASPGPGALRDRLPLRLARVVLVLLGLLVSSSVLATDAATRTIEGQVVDARGEPLAGAAVEILDPDPAWLGGRFESRPSARARTVTRRDGRYRLAPPSLGAWQVVVQSPGHGARAFDLPPSATHQVLPTVTLPNQRAHGIRLVTSGRQPLAGVEVRSLEDMPTVEGWRPVVSRRVSAADGMVELAAAKGGGVLVATRHGDGGLYELLTPERLAAKASTVELVVDPEWALVQVVDPRGRPLPDITVALAKPWWVLGRTGRGGEVAVPASALAPGTLGFFDGLGARGASIDSVPGAGDRWVVRLEPARDLVGRVADAYDGRGVADAWVWSAAGPVRSDHQGAFRLRIDERAPTVGLLATGYLERQLRLPARRAAKPVDLGLIPALVLDGRVVDAGGQPVAGVEIRLEPEPVTWSTADWVAPEIEESDGGRQEWASRDLPKTLDREARTDAQGNFRLAPMAPDLPATLHLRRQGFARHRVAVDPLARQGAAEPLEVVLTAGLQLTGVVVDEAGNPVDTADVTLRPTHLEVTSEVDGAGRFVLDDLAAGTVHLAVTAPGFAPAAVADIALQADQPSVDLGEIVLEPETRLAGRVVTSDGHPVAGARIWARRAGSPALGPAEHRLISDGDGRFVMPGLALGARVQLRVRHPRFLEARLAGEILDASRPLEITLRPGLTLQGTVVRADGSAVPRARVVLQSLDFPEAAEVTTTSRGDGRFLFPGLPPGRFSLGAQARQGRVDPQEVVLVPSQESTETTLVVTAAAVVRGRVVGPTGRGLPGVRVVAEGLAGTLTDADGHFRLGGLGRGLDGGLESDVVTLEASHAEYASVRRVAQPGEDVEIALLDWHGRREVAGWVVGPAGETIGGALIQLYDVSQGPGRVGQTTSRHDGSFEVAATGDGHYLVEVLHPGYPPYRGNPFLLRGDDVGGLVLQLGGP